MEILGQAAFEAKVAADKAAQQTPLSEPAPAEPTPAAEPAQPVNSEPPQPAPQEPVFDWKQEITKVDKDEVLRVLGVEAPAQKSWEDMLKEQGFDEFGINALKYYKQTGSIAEYAEVKSVDYTKMSAEEILRRDIDKKYSGLSKEERDLLYKAEVVDKYKLDRNVFDDVESEEVRIGLIKLKQDAEAKRQEFIESQNKFKAPEKQPDTEAQQREEAIRKQYEDYVSLVQSDENTKNLLSGKILTLGEGDNTFKFEVSDPQKFVDATIDNNKLFSHFVDEKGNYKFGEWYALLNYAFNRKEVEKRIWDEATKRAKAENFAQMTNAQSNTPNQPDTATATRKPIVKNGVVVGFE